MAALGHKVRWEAKRRLKSVLDAAAGRAAALLLALVHRCDRVWITNCGGAFMRTIGPWLPEHRTGRANLRAAFPEKSDAEIETILRGVWDNLGRTGAEIAHLDHICSGDRYNRTYIDYTPESIERFLAVKDDGKPAVVFAAHLANWELPAVIAASDGLESTVLYRRPNLGAVADAVIALRKGIMGEMVASSLGAPVTLARALERGRHVAMLVDQHYVRGIDVTFFGRNCKVNPLIAMLAREAECPIHGTRVWRLPGNRFGAEISPAVEPVRDAEGRIEVAGTMQAITSVVESWVREHPEQWLWLHRRWR
ncbi:MAG: lipid A biosynthesis lauroyl acyltransferase [Xanthobacteraceae bacterium]|nr:lipid A biosynthesis lauroyl acyltransferase [Xanthobacteraceae bacterium]